VNNVDNYVLQRQSDRRGRRHHTQKGCYILLRLAFALTISCDAFLFLFLVSDPSGSSTSIPSTSLRPAAPLEPRLLAFCFSRRRSATSLSTTLSASSCSAFSCALAALWSERETSFASSVWRSVAVVEDQCSREVRISVMDSWGASLSDGIFYLEVLLLLVQSPADDVEIDGLDDEVL